MRSDSNDKRKKRGIGLKFAWNGFWEVLKHERNFQIHLIVGIIIICAGFFLQLTAGEWVMIVLVIGFVLTAEMINTTIEKLINYLKPEIHPEAKTIKDIAAATVLIAAVIAVIIGFIVFLPKLYSLL
ncbi:diacylglycerol kinase [Virgibacillus dakarensis]|uniref:Undecaprenol kinase n=1 Tax=Lentibacillus populi TaxID=1827502 RepID=A0A9W5TTY3_9BACI|nr:MULTISPECIES: diacylglycerol kinase family protein [Bacillaceae]MBT2214497.1 diacylglycerol kinase family protein [Virgibacillus dakarensis]MTW84102.1 diacylglycerol kinase [Virgibacillus dakarensis]GGB29089.1 undecaprenol kinase [Lentibacillus populi]